jgi:hypothetical protein
MRTKSIVIILVATALLLMVPLVAMQFTDEVDWSLFDFIAMGALLSGTGLLYEFVASRGGSTAYRVGVGVACTAGLFLIWVNLAVGLIGNEDNPANALYLGVIAIALSGVALSSLEPRGMARTMFATAAVQVAVPIVALIIWRPSFDLGVVQVFGANAMFVTLWIIAGSFFRHASTNDPKWEKHLQRQ